MTQQATLEFGIQLATPGDQVAFDIGWDHAHHALVPPAELLLEGSPVAQGWRAGRAVFGRRTRAASRLLRLWLALRLRAWREGRAFETTQVTPHFLGQIEVGTCPVTRRLLGGARDGADAPVVVRLCEEAGYAAGNLVMMSRAAAQARTGCSLEEAWSRSQQLERGLAPSLHGLDADAWARLATLISFTTLLPHTRAQRLPMRVLPPNRVRLLNAAQGLQALLTMHLAAPGWSQRARTLADRLPQQSLRQDFNLFVAALAPRLLEAQRADTDRGRREALEDAWADIRVHRRWQLLMAQLGEHDSEQLSEHLASQGIAGHQVRVLAADAATDGWALPPLPASPAMLQGLRRRQTQRAARPSPTPSAAPQRRAGDARAA